MEERNKRGGDEMVFVYFRVYWVIFIHDNYQSQQRPTQSNKKLNTKMMSHNFALQIDLWLRKDLRWLPSLTFDALDSETQGQSNSCRALVRRLEHIIISPFQEK